MKNAAYTEPNQKGLLSGEYPICTPHCRHERL